MRVVHMAKPDFMRGEPSALCYSSLRAIDTRRHGWTITPTRVTCKRCQKRMRQEGQR